MDAARYKHIETINVCMHVCSHCFDLNPHAHTHTCTHTHSLIVVFVGSDVKPLNL